PALVEGPAAPAGPFPEEGVAVAMATMPAALLAPSATLLVTREAPGPMAPLPASMMSKHVVSCVIDTSKIYRNTSESRYILAISSTPISLDGEDGASHHQPPEGAAYAEDA